jgi:Aspartyl protease
MQPKRIKIRSADLLCVFLLTGMILLPIWPEKGTSITSIVAAPVERQTAKREPVAVVRFELYHNRVLVPVQINESSAPTVFIIDTGATLSVLTDAQAKALGIEFRNKGDIKNAGNGEESIHLSLAKNIRFRLGGADILAKYVGVVPLQSWERFEGRTIAGILGADLFKKYVVEADYDNQTLTLFEPGSFDIPQLGQTIQLKLLGGSIPVVEATLEISQQSSLKAHLVVDMGTYSALRLNRPFVEQHKLLAGAPKLVPSLGFGIEGDFRESLGRLQGLRLGTLSMENVLTSFSQASRGQTTIKAYDGSMGGELLRHFRVTFDYSHKLMIWLPGRNFEKVDEADMSGAVLIASVPDFSSIRVQRVFEGSPAAESGLREGDLFLTVDSRSAPELGLEGIRELFSIEALYVLKVKRGGQDIELRLSTRRLI